MAVESPCEGMEMRGDRVYTIEEWVHDVVNSLDWWNGNTPGRSEIIRVAHAWVQDYEQMYGSYPTRDELISYLSGATSERHSTD